MLFKQMLFKQMLFKQRLFKQMLFKQMMYKQMLLFAQKSFLTVAVIASPSEWNIGSAGCQGWRVGFINLVAIL
jgi:hypothetical protein